MTTNDEINWEKNEQIISKYGIQTWRNGKRTPEYLVSVTHTGVSLNNMLNEARTDTARQIFKQIESQDLLSLRKVNGVGLVVI